ncbi:MAG: hypothetical protein JXQ83_10070, partial [Candidatus Glassbacteria bacterium]|nr:hypothetical protein [Candidatus Glassbacteria bacterium]
AMAFCLFWPSLILWSVTLLKETSLALYVSLVIYLFVELIKRKKWWHLVPVCLLWYPLKEIRVNSHYLMLLTISLSLIFFLPRRKAYGLLLAAGLAAACLAAGHSRIKPLYQEFQNMVIAAQMGYITTGGSYYKFIPERFGPNKISGGMITPGEMTISFCKALYYYLCVPNPFIRIKASQAPVAPQMVIWYALLLFCLPAGVLHLVRHHYRESGIVLVYILVFISALAIFTGNEGAAFRQRDMVTPFFFIPISVGMFNLLGWLAVKVKHRVEPAPPAAESTGDDRAGY